MIIPTKQVLYILFLPLILLSCSNRTEFGRKRPIYIGKKQVTFDPATYNIIDTAALYLPEDKYTESYPKTAGKYTKGYLKFYGAGRVGTFYLYDSSEAIANPDLLNPKRAALGYYRNGKVGMELITHFEHVQGGGFIKEQLIKIKNDSFQLSYQGKEGTRYIKIPLPKQVLLFHPDW